MTDWSTADPVAPAPGQYLGQVSLSFAVEPVRVGYLVREGDADQLATALLAASQAWGGLRRPVLPLSVDGTVADHWVRIGKSLALDHVLDLTWDRRSGWGERGDAAWPVSPFRAGDPLDGTAHLFAVHQPAELERLRVCVPTVGDLVGLAGLGGVRADARDEWRRWGVTVVEAGDDADAAVAQLDGECVAAVSGWRDDVVRGIQAPATTALVWVVADEADDGAVWADLVGFWDARALRPGGGPTVLVREGVLKDERVREALDRAVRRDVWAEPHVALVSESVPRRRLDDLAVSLGWEPVTVKVLTERWGHPAAGAGPIHAAINLSLPALWVGPRLRGRRGGVAVQAHRPSTDLRVASPMPWHPRMLARGQIGFAVGGALVTGPRRRSVASLYHPHATWDGDRLRWFTAPQSEWPWEITVPTGRHVLDAALADARARAEPNDKARQVEGVLAAAAADPGLVLEPAWGAVVRALTAPPSRNLRRQLDAAVETGAISRDTEGRLLADSAFARVPDRSLDDVNALADGADRETVAEVLGRAVAVGLVHRGLRVDCPMCRLVEFVRFPAVVDVPRCGGCGALADYMSPGGEPQLRYRLNSALNRLSANGGLVPLQATAVLRGERAHVLPGADVTRAGAPVGEVDLIGWRGEVVFTGEAKTTATRFTAEQAEKDLAVAQAVDAAEHVLACPQPLPDEALAAYHSAFDRSGISLRLMCGADLTPPPAPR